MSNVLIIEAESDTAKSLQEALAQVGIQSCVAADGNTALDMARSVSPNVIVLCVELVGVSGYSVCNKLKKDSALAAIPLILASSQATEETFEQHKKLKTHAEFYVKKPYRVDAIVDVIQSYLDGRAISPAVAEKHRVASMPTLTYTVDAEQTMQKAKAAVDTAIGILDDYLNTVSAIS